MFRSIFVTLIAAALAAKSASNDDPPGNAHLHIHASSVNVCVSSFCVGLVTRLDI